MLEDARQHWGKQHVALQTDMWSCGWQHEAYSALLASFLTSSWKGKHTSQQALAVLLSGSFDQIYLRMGWRPGGMAVQWERYAGQRCANHLTLPRPVHLSLVTSHFSSALLPFHVKGT